MVNSSVASRPGSQFLRLQRLIGMYVCPEAIRSTGRTTRYSVVPTPYMPPSCLSN